MEKLFRAFSVNACSFGHLAFWGHFLHSTSFLMLPKGQLGILKDANSERTVFVAPQIITTKWSRSISFRQNRRGRFRRNPTKLSRQYFRWPLSRKPCHCSTYYYYYYYALTKSYRTNVLFCANSDMSQHHYPISFCFSSIGAFQTIQK